MSILDTIERVLFGASAAEAVELRIQLAMQRIEQKLVEALDEEDGREIHAADVREVGEKYGPDIKPWRE